MRRLLIPTLAALLAAAATAGIALAGRDHDHHGHRAARYAIGLWGDLPYSTGNDDTNQLQKTVGVPHLIADMNGQPLAFSIHDGDLKDGSSRCSDGKYFDFKASLNTLKAP